MIYQIPIQTGYVLASLMVCAPQQPPLIEFAFKSNPPVFNHEKTTTELSQNRKHSTSPNYGAEFPIVAGLTDGEIKISYGISYQLSTRESTQDTCIWAKKIRILVEYIPNVYIAKNYKSNSCSYNMIYAHEMKHVNTDILTLNQYMPYFKNVAMRSVVSWHGVGPIKLNQADTVQKSIAAEFSTAVTAITNVFEKTRTSRQQQVDTRQEYSRLSKECPHERSE